MSGKERGDLAISKMVKGNSYSRRVRGTKKGRGGTRHEDNDKVYGK